MTPREIEEYSALRATIRERGSIRVCLFVAGLAAWAGAAILTAALLSPPVATLVPLLVLAAAFEAVLSLHLGVERIGRYLQVFFEDETADPGWEGRIMAFGGLSPGAAPPAAAVDPLFTIYFWLAAGANLLPAALASPVPSEWLVLGALHALFAFRVAAGRRDAARQRGIDLQRFTQIKTQSRRDEIQTRRGDETK